MEKGTAESNHLELTKFIDVVSRKIMMMKVTVALVAEYQNLNSGKRLKRTLYSFVNPKNSDSA